MAIQSERLTDKEFVASLKTHLNCYGDKNKVGQAKCAFCPFKKDCLEDSTK